MIKEKISMDIGTKAESLEEAYIVVKDFAKIFSRNISDIEIKFK